MRGRHDRSLLAVEPGDRAVPGQFGAGVVGRHLGRGPATGDLNGGDGPHPRPPGRAPSRCAASAPRSGRPARRPWPPCRSASTRSCRYAGRRRGRRGKRPGRGSPEAPSRRPCPRIGWPRLPSWSLFERRTVTLADPSLRNSTSAQVSAAASPRRSMASRMTEMSATSTRPLGAAARTGAAQVGGGADRLQRPGRERGGLPRGAALLRRPAGEPAHHAPDAFVVGRIRVSGVADGGCRPSPSRR